ncbi:MAG: AtpZ/AtpI family protein [Chloroflexota bacterium]
MTQSESEKPDKNRTQYVFNLTLAAVAGQVGFLTLFVILFSLFGGLWLDKQFDTKPLFTLILLLASVPVTLVMMFWVVNKATARIKPTSPKEQSQEDAERGRNS